LAFCPVSVVAYVLRHPHAAQRTRARTYRGAIKLSKLCFNRLLQLQFPPLWQDEIDLANLTIRTRPAVDREEILPVCYRCQARSVLTPASWCSFPYAHVAL
jgi:hypothetical protein